ncbi:MAG TPA: transglycosylase family protein [Candidatus Limnocylindria bacterium]|jgi:hypothetical protein
MTILRRIGALAVISLSGVILVAPLAARSAAPAEPVVPESLLVQGAGAGTVTADRGGFTSREAGATPSGSTEALAGAALPTPATAPMEATLVGVPTPAPVVAAPPPAAPPVTYAGTSVWDDLAECESGGNWAINTGNGYYGGLQFSYATWHGYGGAEFAEYPHQASREEQIIVAERLRAERGYAPWPACSAELGLS